MNNIKQITHVVLVNDEKARTNDIHCICEVLKRMNLPTDLNKLEEYPSNILETIRRVRQKIQQENPFLANPNIRSKRNDRQEIFKRLARS